MAKREEYEKKTEELIAPILSENGFELVLELMTDIV